MDEARLPHLLCLRVTLRSAAITFAAGWSLFWCAALHITNVVPLWVPLLVLVAALLMIPLAGRCARSPGKLKLGEAAAPAAE